MTDSIGECAGVVWRYLSDHGECSFSKLLKGTGLKQREADRAVGWLAREGKVGIRKEKNAEIITLS